MTLNTNNNLHTVRKSVLVLEQYARETAERVRAFVEQQRQIGQTETTLAKHFYELEQWQEIQTDAIRQLRQVNSMLGLSMDADVPVQILDLSEVLF